MARIMVPTEVFPGFKIITGLRDTQLNDLIEFLKVFDFSKYYGEIANDLSETLKIDGHNLFRTLLSFTGLSESDVASLSKNLAESYNELSEENLNSTELDKLKANLILILTNFERVQLADKVRESKFENTNNFKVCKFRTDIRFMQADDTTKCNYGIILHKFCLEFQNSDSQKELHCHIEIEDLIQLKAEIEKAIERDNALRKSFSGDIQLI